ncbi:MAG: 5-amino-6-(D-ribitylamino)uracil--L-tyrosine 4-hydroxyphenyl transferase CofH, partial [Gammaproteobacteria bacterium]|nr:5-amino-6-(D-ribitylamino)uracil--L-tyrosine 4-hydroxyphenyl transferase CofH [Gammaproteobacteria bacterium]
YGHIQEIIIQNFVPKPGTLMHAEPEPAFDELRWTIAVARLIFGPQMSIQVPPNLNAGRLPELLAAGINDWGGVSPVTPDHVNPESPWPELQRLADETAAAGHQLTERLTIYPNFIAGRQKWLDKSLYKPVLAHADASGLARNDHWSAGATNDDCTTAGARFSQQVSAGVRNLTAKACAGERLDENEIVGLFSARDADLEHVCSMADELRSIVSGDDITYTVNRNINYTNMCTYRCTFCAFSRGKAHKDLRGEPYLLDMPEIARRTREAWERGATEVCLQGGIHPSFTGDTYLEICATVKAAAPDIHVHAFSALEITHGAATLGISVGKFLQRLQQAGLGTLPGTAAEILDDEVRAILCADKVNTEQWLTVMRAAHENGIRTTSTIMFGHVETPVSWARHLLALRDLQAETGGFTEFVPLPFVHMEAPVYRRGEARRGPTYREVLLMHAVGRLVLNPLITNIQTSWVKLGVSGVRDCLSAGANDLGGTLMNESISRAAGASFGQELPPSAMDELIDGMNRGRRIRNTLYGDANAAQVERAYAAGPLAPLHNRPARDLKAAS